MLNSGYYTKSKYFIILNNTYLIVLIDNFNKKEPRFLN